LGSQIHDTSQMWLCSQKTQRERFTAWLRTVQRVFMYFECLGGET